MDRRDLEPIGVDVELEALPADIRPRFAYISRLIEEFGLERVREPHIKHLGGRLIYVTATCQRVVVVRIFVKKTQKTPKGEIELALKRAKELRQ